MTPERWHYTSRYLQEIFGREDALLAELRTEATTAGLPDIAVSADVGRMLDLLVRTTRARTLIEVGTLGGYSALWLARAMHPEGRLFAIEIDADRAAFARRWFDRAGVGDRVEVVIGAALDVLPSLIARCHSHVDVVFLDAVKEEYPAYFELVRDAIAPGGLLLADNVLGSSSWWIDQESNPTRIAVDAFNRAVVADTRFDVAAVPIREGVLIARRRETT
jgi:predicted O-methyltransferase YrrM